MSSRRRFTLISAVIIAIALICPSGSEADVIYTTGSSGANPPIPSGSPGGSRDVGNFILADDFTLSQGATWTDVHFWSLEAVGSSGPTLIQYYLFDVLPATGFGTPSLSGSVTTYTRQATGRTASPGGSTLAEYYYSFDLSAPYSLNAASYWLALHFGATRAFLGKSWVSYDVTNGAGNYFYYPPGSTTANWTFDNPTNKDQALAFELTGPAVPEPGSMLLVGSGLIGLAGAVRRRMRK